MTKNLNNGVLMWLFTFILLIGFILIYKNLNNEIVFGSKYEGLYVSIFGLIASVFVGVNTSKQGIENFVSLYSF